MKYRDLVAQLKAAGWVITKENPHYKARHPSKPGVKIPIPHHREIADALARAILKQAGL